MIPDARPNVRASIVERETQRPFLPGGPLALLNAGVLEKGEGFAANFGFSAFGFFFSRLPRCSRFATADLLWGLVM